MGYVPEWFGVYPASFKKNLSIERLDILIVKIWKIEKEVKNKIFCRLAKPRQALEPRIEIMNRKKKSVGFCRLDQLRSSIKSRFRKREIR